MILDAFSWTLSGRRQQKNKIKNKRVEIKNGNKNFRGWFKSRNKNESNDHAQ